MRSIEAGSQPHFEAVQAAGQPIEQAVTPFAEPAFLADVPESVVAPTYPKLFRKPLIAVGGVAAAILTACGGGGGDDPRVVIQTVEASPTAGQTVIRVEPTPTHTPDARTVVPTPTVTPTEAPKTPFELLPESVQKIDLNLQKLQSEGKIIDATTGLPMEKEKFKTVMIVPFETKYTKDFKGNAVQEKTEKFDALYAVLNTLGAQYNRTKNGEIITVGQQILAEMEKVNPEFYEEYKKSDVLFKIFTPAVK